VERKVDTFAKSLDDKEKGEGEGEDGAVFLLPYGRREKRKLPSISMSNSAKI